MRRHALWAFVAVLAVMRAVNVNAGLLEDPTSSPRDTSPLETSPEDCNGPCATTDRQSTTLYFEDEEMALEVDDSDRNNTKSLSGDHRTTNDPEDGAAHHEEQSNYHEEKTNDSSYELKGISDDDSSPSLTSNTTSTSVALPSNPSKTDAEPSSSSSSAVEASFPPSREAEQKEDKGGRQIGDIIAFLLARWGPEQKFKSVVQILFFHIYIISFFYLFVVLHQGILSVIDLLRTPLLIYKEVDDYEEVKGYPAPTLPPLHKDYGYTGGFKTPEGEEIKYVPYPAPEQEYSNPVDADTEEEPAMPVMMPGNMFNTPATEEHVAPIEAQNEPEVYYDPDAEVPQEPPFEFSNAPPPLGAFAGSSPQVAGGGEEVSSYVSYVGQRRNFNS